MRIMTGFLEPDSGSVSYNKVKLNSNNRHLKFNIGYLPENNPLYKDMRVDEYLLFKAKLRNSKNKPSLRKIAKKCGLLSVLTKPIETLSKGFKQRVGLANALIGDPEFLILDEPTEGLDPNQKEKIHDLIKHYAEDKTVLFSSHVLSEVSTIADTIIIINNGKIVAQGDRDELVQKHFKGAIIHLKINAKVTDLRSAFKKNLNIRKIEKTSSGRLKYISYDLVCSKPEETSIRIFDTAVKNNWKIVEMFQKSQGLEELFKDLTK
jgi:ABC-2 type transport system ATP-binding protein